MVSWHVFAAKRKQNRLISPVFRNKKNNKSLKIYHKRPDVHKIVLSINLRFSIPPPPDKSFMDTQTFLNLFRGIIMRASRRLLAIFHGREIAHLGSLQKESFDWRNLLNL